MTPNEKKRWMMKYFSPVHKHCKSNYLFFKHLQMSYKYKSMIKNATFLDIVTDKNVRAFYDIVAYVYCMSFACYTKLKIPCLCKIFKYCPYTLQVDMI